MRMIGFAFLCMFGSLAQVPEPSISNIMPAKYVADAAEQLTGHRAHMTNEIRLLAGTRLASPAVTLRIVRDETASRFAEGLAAIKATGRYAGGFGRGRSP